MTPEETDKPKRTRQPKQDKHLCHVHDKCDDDDRESIHDDRESIHKYVCRDLETMEHTNGNYYCLLHLPTTEKDAEKFQQIIDERFDEVANRITKIEAELPEADWNAAKDKLRYDFGYVWFPRDCNFKKKTFRGEADFSSATFSGYANFRSAKFTGFANFIAVIFTNKANFKWAKFIGDSGFVLASFAGKANFRSAKFTGNSYFKKATFTDRVNFSSVKFASSANFKSTTFASHADFISPVFTGKADFSSTVFTCDADFSLAKFKDSVFFSRTTFTSSADFKSATISGNAFFNSVTFSDNASFNSVTISGEADFSSATFRRYAFFNSVTFSGDANFSSATISGNAGFSSATFSGDADFSSTTFCSNTNFSSATFEEKSQTYFNETRFCSSVWFGKAVIEGYIEFEGHIFLEADKVQIVKRELETKFAELKAELAEREIEFKVPAGFIKDGQEAVFEFRDVRLRNPERVTFNSLQLRPSWFVNVDEARKVAFNDVEWLNTEIDVDRIGLDLELNSLKKREIKRAERSLIKACNQLADNAEANRRFEEAKQFRKQGIALENKECYICDDVNPHLRQFHRKNVCGDYPVVNEFGGRCYCLWHYPDKDKAETFLKELEKRQKNKHQEYYGVVFPTSIMFQDELPNELDFRKAKFYSLLAFVNAKIHKILFTEAEFTEESELYFENSYCVDKIILDDAAFDGKLFLNGTEHQNFFAKAVDPNIKNGKVDALNKGLSLKDTRFSNPNQINFRSARLRPHYFVDVDSSKLIFHDCDWKDENGKQLSIEQEIKCCSHKSLAQSCNHLAINYEESRQFEESSYFRYTAMEAKRLSYQGIWKYTNLFWLYKWTSGYGENWTLAALVLLGVLVFFGYLYASPLSAFDYGKEGKPASADTVAQNLCEKVRLIGNPQMNVCEGILHSLSVATFQRPEPKAADTLTKLFVVLEVIFAPLQAALLALAIRRKFMR